MDRRYMTKQYLTRIVTRKNGWFRVFDVFSTGDPKWILFCQVAGADDAPGRPNDGAGGYATGIQSAVQRRELQRDIARMIPRP